MESSYILLKQKDFEKALLEWLYLINNDFKIAVQLEDFLLEENISIFIDLM